MNILDVRPLTFPEVQVIRFRRFRDPRGYFAEHFRKSDIRSHPLTQCLHNVEFVQANESFSRAGTVRGLHFQWDPAMGKLVRTIQGHMIDLVLDVRKGSPAYGKVIAHDMPADPGGESGEWIWVPPGFPHGNLFLADTSIEYFCSGEYNPAGEAGISPLAADLDWSLCDGGLKEAFDRVARHDPILSDKDRNGLSLAGWERDERSRHPVFTAAGGAAAGTGRR